MTLMYATSAGRPAPTAQANSLRRDHTVSGERLGARLRRLRVAAGLTQNEAARRADLSVGTLRDLEQGRTAAPRKASLTALVRLGPLADELDRLDGERAK